jgi:hypothetical protein
MEFPDSQAGMDHRRTITNINTTIKRNTGLGELTGFLFLSIPVYLPLFRIRVAASIEIYEWMMPFPFN